MPKDIHISASLLKDYLECPFKAYWRSHYQVEVIETPYMVVGNIVHTIIEKQWRDQAEAIRAVEQEIISRGVQEVFASKARDCVNNFFSNFSHLLFENDEIEYRFKLPFGKAFIVGKIDRITTSGILIDWKTGVVNSSNLARDPQFILYKYVYQQIFKKEPTTVMKANLADGSIESYNGNKVTEYNLINGIIPIVIDQISQGTLAPTGLLTGKCSRCQFKPGCHRELGY